MKNFEALKLSFPELEHSVKQSTKGGWDTYSGGGGGGSFAWVINLGGDVTIRPDGGNSHTTPTPNYTTDPNFGTIIRDYYGTDYQNGGGGGSSAGGSTSVPRPPRSTDPAISQWRDNLSTAITAGMAAPEAYATLDMARLGTLALDARGIAKNIFDTNPVETFKNLIGDVKNMKGLAILDAGGKALGVWAAVDSAYTLYEDIADGGDFNYMNLADATVNVGSLFVKSNLVGITVSLGWMVIKTAIESPEAQSIIEGRGRDGRDATAVPPVNDGGGRSSGGSGSGSSRGGRN